MVTCCALFFSVTLPIILQLNYTLTLVYISSVITIWPGFAADYTFIQAKNCTRVNLLGRSPIRRISIYYYKKPA